MPKRKKPKKQKNPSRNSACSACSPKPISSLREFIPQTWEPRYVCRLHSSEVPAPRTHPIHIYAESCPLHTFNSSVDSKRIICYHLQQIFFLNFYWSFSVLMTYTWTGSKPQGRGLIPGCKAVLSTGLPQRPQSPVGRASARRLPPAAQREAQRSPMAPTTSRLGPERDK